MISLASKRKAESEAESSGEGETCQLCFQQLRNASGNSLLNQQAVSCARIPTARIFTLPEPILLSIFEIWLSLSEIARFDSAVCNDRDRGLLMFLLRRLVYRNLVKLEKKGALHSWLVQRRIGLKYISINDDSFDNVRLKWSVVKRIEVHPSRPPAIRFLTRCPNLEDIEFLTPDYRDGGSTLDEILNFLKRVSSNLSNSTVEALAFDSKFRSDSLISLIASNFPQLEDLTVSLDRCSDDTLSALFTNCTELRYLVIDSLPQKNPVGIRMRPNINLLELIFVEEVTCANFLCLFFKNFPNLVYLSVSLRYDTNESDDTDETLVELFTNLLKLQTLIIRNFSYPHKLVAAMKPNLNLQKLCIGGRTKWFVDDGVSVAIGLCFPNLKELQLFVYKGSNEGIISIAECCQNLRKLNIYESVSGIRDASLAKLLENCTELEDLELSGLCELTDQSYLNIFRYRHKLRRFKLNRDVIDGSKLFDYAETFCCRHLKELHINSSEITDAVLLMILRSCPNLTIIYLEQCTKLTEVSLFYIATHCRNLTTLYLDHLSTSKHSKYLELIYENNTRLDPATAKIVLPHLSWAK